MFWFGLFFHFRQITLILLHGKNKEGQAMNDSKGGKKNGERGEEDQT